MSMSHVCVHTVNIDYDVRFGFGRSLVVVVVGIGDRKGTAIRSVSSIGIVLRFIQCRLDFSYRCSVYMSLADTQMYVCQRMCMCAMMMNHIYIREMKPSGSEKLPTAVLEMFVRWQVHSLYVLCVSQHTSIGVLRIHGYGGGEGTMTETNIIAIASNRP